MWAWGDSQPQRKGERALKGRERAPGAGRLPARAPGERAPPWDGVTTSAFPPPLQGRGPVVPGRRRGGFGGGGIVERRAWAIAAHAREGREKEGLHRARRLHHSEENPQTIVQRARAGGLAGGQGLPRHGGGAGGRREVLGGLRSD